MTTYNQNKSSSLTAATEELDPLKRGDRSQRADGSWSTGEAAPAPFGGVVPPPPAAATPPTADPTPFQQTLGRPKSNPVAGTAAGLLPAGSTATPGRIDTGGGTNIGQGGTINANDPRTGLGAGGSTGVVRPDGASIVPGLPIPAGSIIKMNQAGEGRVVDPRTGKEIGTVIGNGLYRTDAPTPGGPAPGLRAVRGADGNTIMWNGALQPGMAELTQQASQGQAVPQPPTQSASRSSMSAIPQQGAVPPPPEQPQSTQSASKIGAVAGGLVGGAAGALTGNPIQGTLAGAVAGDRATGGGTVTPKQYTLAPAPGEYNLPGYLKDPETNKLYPPGTSIDPTTGDITLGHGINGQTGADMFGTVIKRDVGGQQATPPPAGAVPQNQNPITQPGIPALPTAPTPQAPVTGGNANTGENAASTVATMQSDQLLKQYLQAGLDDIRANASAQKRQLGRGAGGADSGMRAYLERRVDENATAEARKLETALRGQNAALDASGRTADLAERKLAFDQATQKSKDNISMFNSVLSLGALASNSNGGKGTGIQDAIMRALGLTDESPVEGATSVDDRLKLGFDDPLQRMFRGGL